MENNKDPKSLVYNLKDISSYVESLLLYYKNQKLSITKKELVDCIKEELNSIFFDSEFWDSDMYSFLESKDLCPKFINPSSAYLYGFKDHHSIGVYVPYVNWGSDPMVGQIRLLGKLNAHLNLNSIEAPKYRSPNKSYEGERCMVLESAGNNYIVLEGYKPGVYLHYLGFSTISLSGCTMLTNLLEMKNYQTLKTQLSYIHFDRDILVNPDVLRSVLEAHKVLKVPFFGWQKGSTMDYFNESSKGIGVSEWYSKCRSEFLKDIGEWHPSYIKNFKRFLSAEVSENLCSTPLDLFTSYFCEHYFYEKDQNVIRKKLGSLQSVACHIPKNQLKIISNIVCLYIESCSVQKDVSRLLNKFAAGRGYDYITAEYFSKVYNKKYIFDTQTESWYTYKDNKWQVFKKTCLSSAVYEFFKDYHYSVYLPELSVSLVEKTVKGLSHLEMNILKDGHKWDHNPTKLIFENALYDISKGCIKPLYPALYNRSVLPFKISDEILKKDLIDSLKDRSDIDRILDAGDPQKFFYIINQICPTIHKIISELSNSDYLCYVFYIILLVVTLNIKNLEVIIFLYGLSNAGKSTFLRLLSMFIDPQSTMYIQTRDLNSDFGLSGLAHRHNQLLVIPEAEGGGMTRAAIAKMKNLTSSQDQIQLNLKFMNLVNMIFDGLLCVASNEPVFAIESEGIINKRLIPIVLEQTFSKQNSTDVLEGIPDSEFINFMVAMNTLFKDKKQLIKKEMYKFRNNHQLVSCYQKILKAKNNLRIVEFLQDCFVEAPGESVPLYRNSNTDKTAVYTVFMNYLEESGEDRDISKTEFKEDLMYYVGHLYQNRVTIERERYPHKNNKNKTARVLSLVNIRLRSFKDEPNLTIPTKPQQTLLNNNKQVITAAPIAPKIAPIAPKIAPPIGEFLASGESQISAQAKKTAKLDEISISGIKAEVTRDENSCIGATQVTVYNADNPPNLMACNRLREPSWMGLDIETTGVDLIRNDMVFSIQFCIPSANEGSKPQDQHVFVLYNIPEILESMQGTNNAKWMKFFKAFWDALHVTQIIGHNLAFDLIGIFKIFQEAPFEYSLSSIANMCKPGKTLDTYLMCKYMENGLKTSLSLENSIKKHLNIELEKGLHDDFKTSTKAEGFVDWYALEIHKGRENLIKYMIFDVIYLHQFSECLTRKMTDRISDCYTNNESQFLILFVKMSLQGINVDIDTYKQQSSELQLECEQQYKWFVEKYIQPNILESWFSAANKKKYLKWYDRQEGSLFDFLKQQKITPDTRSLFKGLFASQELPNNNFNQKELTKIKNDLMDNNSKQADAQLDFLKDYEHLKEMHGMQKKFKQFHTYSDKIHCFWNAFKTHTGRIVSTKLAIQTMDKKMRPMVTAPPNYKLVIGDLSTIELRLIAECSKDAKFLEVFKNEDADLHLATAQALFPDKQLNKKSAERMTAKAVNFGLAYGATENGLYENLKFGWGIDITREQAKQYHENWFKTYPGVSQWSDIQHASTLRLGYAESALGRARFWPSYELRKYVPAGNFDHLRNACINHPIQSSCVDILYRSLEQLKKHSDLFDNVLLLVHDEIVLACKDEPQLLENAKQKLTQAMAMATKQVFRELNENSPQCDLPDHVLVDVNIQDNWTK